MERFTSKIITARTGASTPAEPNQINLLRRSNMANESLPFSNSTTKTCSRCKRELPRNEFGKDARYANGLKSRCHQCERELRPKAFGGYGAPFEEKLERDRMLFWSNVQKTETCWLWTGPQTDDHYGTVWSRALKGRHRAHRFVWYLTYGHLPGEQVVCHACDTPLCVRPDHLWLGTLSDNSRDMWQKGRAIINPNKGTANGRAKLTEADVRVIREKYATGTTSLPKLGKEYGVSVPVIHGIVRGTAWRHVK